MRAATRCLLVALAAGALGGAGALVTARLVDPPPRVATVDLAALVRERLASPEIVALPDVERAGDAARFATRLEHAVTRLADEYGVALFAAPAVVAGAPDLTDLLRARLELADAPR